MKQEWKLFSTRPWAKAIENATSNSKNSNIEYYAKIILHILLNQNNKKVPMWNGAKGIKMAQHDMSC